MHAATLRRLIVFGVCAVGVGCLHLLPGMARTPHQIAGPQPSSEPTRPASRAARGASEPLSPPAEASASRTAAEAPAEEGDEASRSQPVAAQPSISGATAFRRADRTDEESPAPVTDLTSAEVTSTRLSLSWPAASDNVGVVGYTVVLDGFEVATTAETSATIRWFNNDAREHSVQVRALDAAGNVSASSPNLLVAHPPPRTDPTPEPSTPTPQPTAAPSPTPQPSPSASPSASGPAGSPDEPGRPSPSQSPGRVAPDAPRASAPAEAR